MLLAWADQQRRFAGPVRIIWARDDKLMPPAHAEQLADDFQHTQLVWIDDSYTVIPIDQPQALTDHLRASSTRTPEAGGAQAPTGTNSLPRPSSCFDWRRRHKLTVDTPRTSWA